MRFTKYHGMLGALGGGCSIVGGVIGWSIANKIPQAVTSYDSASLVLQQNGKSVFYGLLGMGIIGISAYWLAKIAPDILKDEIEKSTKKLNEAVDKDKHDGKDKVKLNEKIDKTKDDVWNDFKEDSARRMKKLQLEGSETWNETSDVKITDNVHEMFDQTKDIKEKNVESEKANTTPSNTLEEETILDDIDIALEFVSERLALVEDCEVFSKLWRLSTMHIRKWISDGGKDLDELLDVLDFFLDRELGDVDTKNVLQFYI